jgi:hypothetical protein
MNKLTRILAAIVLIFVLLFNTVSCDILLGNSGDNGIVNNGGQQDNEEKFYINGPSTVDMKVGDVVLLNLVTELEGEIIWTSSSECASVANGIVTALDEGQAVIKAAIGSVCDYVTVNISAAEDSDNDPPSTENPDDVTPENPDDPNGEQPENPDVDNPDDSDGEDEYVFGSEYPCITIAEALEIAEGFTSAASTDIYYMVGTVTTITSASNGEMYIADDSGSIYVYRSSYVTGEKISATDLTVGDYIIISGTLRNYKGTLEIEKGTVINHYTPGVDTPTKPDQGGNGGNGGSGGDGEDVIIPGTGDPITSDPYVNVNENEFYANYTPAISYMDAYYRSKHNLMSGSIAEQDQAPTISAYQPRSNGKLIRNSICLYSDDGNTYYVVDCYGEIAFEIYKGGAYVILEEVAAYVYAFGEPPVNQTSSKSTSPTSSPWGKYLRLNHSSFSGDTSRYPYEPVLPDISGCGGSLRYYEMDIGTTGTDCDPSYSAAIYNNGSRITRGAARIVYTYQDKNGNGTIEFNERYVFYTYNHYNDFQEYLNYEGGWGEMFGNITGGGKISSKYDYNPTPYVEVEYAPVEKAIPSTVYVIYYYVPKNELVA